MPRSAPRFVPGSGKPPPYLAGRERQQTLLLDYLSDLKEGEGAPHDIVISGPRGNGKTALLHYFEQEIEETGVIDVVRWTPKDIKTETGFLKLVPDSWLKNISKKITAIKAETGIADFTLELAHEKQNELLQDALIRRCQKKPLVLLLDEAHNLDLEIGQILLNMSQVTRGKAPFLLVLAGTPDLSSRLDNMEATFWDRGKEIGIGLLDEAGARAALTVPFERSGIGFEEAALAKVVAESQHYPYFLQLWGSALVRQLSGREKQVTGLNVTAAWPDFETQKTYYYEKRRKELQNTGLLVIAARVAMVFQGQEKVNSIELDSVIQQAFTDCGEEQTAIREQVNQGRNTLHHMGFIWNAPDMEDNYTAGIPSLMNYVQQKVARPGHSVP